MPWYLVSLCGEDQFVKDCLHLSKELFDAYMKVRFADALTDDLRSALLLAYSGGPPTCISDTCASRERVSRV